jgi:hypothetical protein
MPLSFTGRPPKKIFAGVGNKILQGLNYIRPENLLAVLLLIAFILAFVRPSAGFYVVAVVFILCYFAERIIKLLPKKNEKDEKPIF